jgi:hypothetical protein
MADFNWDERIAEAIRRTDAIGREEYLDIIDDVVGGLDSDAIIAKHKIRQQTLVSALGHVTAALHGSRPVPPLKDGGWYEPRDTGFDVAPQFTAAWKQARGAK